MWDRPAEQNEADLRAAVTSGTAAGLLALDGGEAAGWCSAGPASAYGRLEGAVEPDEWVLACVLVAPGRRGEGVLRVLVDAAVLAAREAGARGIAGPPRGWRADDGDVGLERLLRALRAARFEDAPAGAPFLARLRLDGRAR